MQIRKITDEEAQAITAGASSRHVRRALERRIAKNNHRHEVEVEAMVRLRKRKNSRVERPQREPAQVWPSGEDKRHDKYLHAAARIARWARCGTPMTSMDTRKAA